MNIRAATEADIDAIGNLHFESRLATYRGLVPDDALDRHDRAARADFWREWDGTSKGRWLLVADDGNEVVGFVACLPEPGEEPNSIEVYALHVMPGRHGVGIGRRLLARAAVQAEEYGYVSLSLEVFVGNPAEGFYERLGGRAGALYQGPFQGTMIPKVRYRWDDLRTLAGLDGQG